MFDSLAWLIPQQLVAQAQVLRTVEQVLLLQVAQVLALHRQPPQQLLFLLRSLLVSLRHCHCGSQCDPCNS